MSVCSCRRSFLPLHSIVDLVRVCMFLFSWKVWGGLGSLWLAALASLQGDRRGRTSGFSLMHACTSVDRSIVSCLDWEKGGYADRLPPQGPREEMYVLEGRGGSSHDAIGWWSSD
mmetsp:Transcript_43153/g.85074  ORF Transcript_43153/g.85074 Transcript_43153/m.85074 type:complete len:115 (-) Transcript_43153:477-821(-)